MKNTSPILNDINEYLVFVSQVKNLSENTTKSYKRDLKKLYLFLEKLNFQINILMETVQFLNMPW